MDADAFSDKYGSSALVTGAAEGLGAEFARQLAERGLDVLLVDVQHDKARARAEAFAGDYGVATRAIECDLARPDFLVDLSAETKDSEIGLLVCCAGLGTSGEFATTPIEGMKRTVQINCVATLELVHHYSAPMVERGRGGIIIIASNSAYSGSPYVANYAATKAYDLTLGEGLWYEFAPKGIDVFAFSPQGTNTPGLRRGQPDLKPGEVREGVMLPEEAVSIALGGLGRLPSLRPDMPEGYSRKRQEVIETTGGIAKSFATYTAAE